MITNSVVSTLRKEDGISARLGNPIRSAFPGAGLTSLVAQMLKNMLAMRETWVQSLGGEYPQEKEIATHSSTLAWKIPWMEDPARLWSMG